MKILLIALINLFIVNSAFASIKGMPREKRDKLYWEGMKKTPENARWFIPENTIRCSSKENLKTAYSHAMNRNGIVDKDFLFNLNCGTGGQWSVGLVSEAPEEGSKIVQLVYALAPSATPTSYGYFHLSSLMTVEQREAMRIN